MKSAPRLHSTRPILQSRCSGKSGNSPPAPFFGSSITRIPTIGSTRTSTVPNSWCGPPDIRSLHNKIESSARERRRRKPLHVDIDSEQASRKRRLRQLRVRHRFARAGHIKGFQIRAAERAVRGSWKRDLQNTLDLAEGVRAAN